MRRFHSNGRLTLATFTEPTKSHEQVRQAIPPVHSVVHHVHFILFLLVLLLLMPFLFLYPISISSQPTTAGYRAFPILLILPLFPIYHHLLLIILLKSHVILDIISLVPLFSSSLFSLLIFLVLFPIHIVNFFLWDSLEH